MTLVWQPGFQQWDPSLISTALWLDADDNTTVFSDAGTTQAVAGTSTVQQWNDKSGNGRHVTQATSNRRPSYTSNGLNGKNIVTFTDDALANATLEWANTTNSIFVVFRRTGGADFQNVIGSGAGEAGRFGYGTTFTATSKYAIFNVLVFPYNFSQSWGNTDILAITSSAAPTSTLIVNGGSSSTVTGAGTTAAGIILGSNATFSEPTQGYIAEFIVLLSVASTNTRQRIEGYLAHKWGLTTNLPADHPYKTNAPAP